MSASAATKRAMQNDPSDSRHGTTNGYCNLRCRCQPCRDAWVQWCRLARIRRAAILAPDDPRHGRAWTYQNHACRCAPCTQAHSEYMRDIPSRRCNSGRVS